VTGFSEITNNISVLKGTENFFPAERPSFGKEGSANGVSYSGLLQDSDVMS